MPRPHRPLVAGGTYHVYSRSRPGLALFQDDDERRVFLRLVARATELRAWRCLSYCLMDTHFHLVLRTPGADLDAGMARILSDFATRLHERRGTRGPVFSGRYGSQLITRDAHLLEVLRYVPLNPVRAGLCRQPSMWPWSSHRALAGEAPRGFVAVTDVHALLGGGPAEYVELVRHAAGAGHVVADPDGCGSPPLPPDRPPLSSLLDPADPWTIARAHHDHGYSLRAIAAALGVNVSTISRRLRRL
jgi:REP element-mobilizing transposase RayT